MGGKIIIKCTKKVYDKKENKRKRKSKRKKDMIISSVVVASGLYALL
jgi:hypothetical protein